MLEQSSYPRVVIDASISSNRAPRVDLERIRQNLLELGMPESDIPGLSIIFKRGTIWNIIGQANYSHFYRRIIFYTRPHERRYIRTGLLSLIGKDPERILEKYHTAVPSGVLGHELKHAADDANGKLPLLPPGRIFAWASGLLFGIYQQGHTLVGPGSPGEKIGSLVGIMLSTIGTDNIYYRFFDSSERNARRSQKEIRINPGRWMVTV